MLHLQHPCACIRSGDSVAAKVAGVAQLVPALSRTIAVQRAIDALFPEIEKAIVPFR